jgi:hypothetical protein
MANPVKENPFNYFSFILCPVYQKNVILSINSKDEKIFME